ncbi:amino acid adenylation domain-containing protein [Streptomyces sp. NPDC059785]|uniref:non-ribosomal peptide synthetase n=1 Tax=Streptomyces sp. NPDC059785 TaxID=3346945 RepID=UPI0036511AD7
MTTERTRQAEETEQAGDAGRAYWHGVLTAGGPTALPRWSADPAPGVAEHEVPVPDRLVRDLRELGVPIGTALLAAHAKVLAALSGEAEVATGLVAGDGGRPLPCRLTAGPGTWRELLLHAHAAEAGLRAHRHFPVDTLRLELGLTEAPYETVLDPEGSGGELDEDTVLRVAAVRATAPAGGARDGDLLALRLRYRTGVLDAESAARIAGYHVTALALLGAGPDTDHRQRALLSAAELRFQLEGLAGPDRELPDRRVHELFEERVAARPDAVAAVHDGEVWTYAELNSRANRLGRALLARGLRPEDVVAVVMERDLDWLAAVLAVFKAGGVYLPVEPGFPAGRIAATLTRAGCGLVVTEHGSTATLDAALADTAGEAGGPGAVKLYADAAYAEGHDDGDLGVTVTAGQLAYIYFTSGSTGEPKGAMCEHAGMLNHVLAKIDDLGIGADTVVAQTAPQCFDISLWQLVSALVTGGRTLIVGQETILDVPAFVDTLVRGRVGVVQLVPSYLEAVLSELEQHPRELPALRRVSVTGEAVKRETVQRWFAAGPGIGLVNAYGLTETSDDTNHEVMDRVPDHARVPLGRPVANVRVYVVDEHLAPVPLGAPGEIVFSGVCVGRGYVNDPERTRQAFLEDPHRPGERLYRSGDQGRWLPDGKLEFLGRRDTQVKLRGFRIEIGEIEAALLRVPGVRDCAVVVARGARLVAFCAGGIPVATEILLERLGRSLPAYMVPSAVHWRESLPLTANGKTDRKTLTALAGELDVVEDVLREPVTDDERRMAAAWAEVLGIPGDRIGRHDDFFDRGGTSLAAVKLAIALDRAVSLKDVTRHPVLADLAGLLGQRAADRAASERPAR